MNRLEKVLIAGILAVLAGIILLEAGAPRPVDWSTSYSRFHKKPYGDLLVHDRLRDLFPVVRSTNASFAATAYDLDEEEAGAQAHLLISDRLLLEDYDIDWMLHRVEMGDHVLLAAEHMPPALQDTLGFALEMDQGARDTMDLRFVGDPRMAPGAFRYTRGFLPSYFTRYDTAHSTVLAVDGRSRPVLVRTRFGRGAFVLCSTPKALTNFGLLKERNATFLAGVLSALPPLPVLWNEHYKPPVAASSSPLRYVLSQRPLRWALWLALVLTVLYILVHARRQQRAIPIMPPPRNATRELVHTLGRLYHQKGDHRDLARKMIAYFREEVRAATYLRTFTDDAATYRHIAGKMGREPDEVREHFARLAEMEQRRHITANDLLTLSNELHNLRQQLHDPSHP